MNDLNAQIERVRKYAISQGVPVYSPRVFKYAASLGIEPSTLEREAGSNPVDVESAARRYAERMGLDVSDPQVRNYVSSGTEDDPAEILDIEGSTDLRFKEAVFHYANSLGLALDARQVQRYARGLLGDAGDFNEDQASEPNESKEQRFELAVQKYANSQRLDVEDPRVQKYAAGLRKSMRL